jgi:hypothetical protein
MIAGRRGARCRGCCTGAASAASLAIGAGPNPAHLRQPPFFNPLGGVARPECYVSMVISAATAFDEA